MITSVSVVDMKMEPSFSICRRRDSALVKLPLWAPAIWPALKSMRIGWALTSVDDPVVE